MKQKNGLPPYLREALAISAILSLISLFNCSGSQQDEEGLETTEDTEDTAQGTEDTEDTETGDYAQGQEGNGQENYADDQYEQQMDEAANNDLGNDTQATDTYAEEGTLNDGGGDFMGEETEATAMPIEDTAMAEAPPMEEAPQDFADDGGGMGQSAPSGPTAPIPGGRVRYVPEGGVQVFSAPNGSPVTNLEQGDHPVTWEDQGWLKITNGAFVPQGSMSDQGVGRPDYGVSWQ
jgi:hypothetical protein